MNRGEELRNKFAAKVAANPFDAQKAQFSDRLDRFLVAEKNASAASGSFVDRFYAEFSVEQPADIAAWFSLKLQDLFICVSGKPKWLFEPSWVFENGVPLEFLHQFSDENGTTFYVFRGYREAELAGVTGKVRFLRLMAQMRDGFVGLDGDVTG
ncbi:hypothetical protein GAO09_28670 [Rhizobiales bacterium RZME27]|jgi:hypothetical protein|uniref:Uncharacterized protein n=1 Tax=Endobacterium cereale TaxID=2663029 RepID=A0A6A8AJF6_9HYPH|nr:hypothetical protein [Endobacterium cereale]MEB2845822.1 hypothetical protein [Endobacterium cereale]MQY50007.1 hypothetical protein [Endobacterium cereale]